MDTIVKDAKAETEYIFKMLDTYNGLISSGKITFNQYPMFQDWLKVFDPEAHQRIEESRKQKRLEEEELAKWEPSKEEIAAAIAAKGWPSFDQITYAHIDDPAERGKLETAVATVKEFVADVKDGAHGLSMIMVANQVDGDMDRTGYGCGKTTLAQAAYYSNLNIMYSKGHPDSIYINPIGRFYSAREVMALFDSENFDQRYTFQNMGKVVVIDDLGREGTLKWEKRDLDMQLQEKQDRYYSLINYCYENGISLIITSNLTSREMATFLGGASWSRLLQMVPKKYRINMTGIRDMRPLLAEQEWF